MHFYVRRGLAAAVSCAMALACGDDGAFHHAESDSESSGAVCPAHDPDCDRIEEECVVEDREHVAAAKTNAPGGSTIMGLGGPKNNAGKHKIWPKGRVPYKVHSSVNSTTKSRLTSAMNEWQNKSKQRVRFVKATASDNAYVLVSEGSPRVEFVGYRANTVSKLYLRDSEYQTVVRHELGHVLGLEHEHRRKDRGSHIQVISSNIVNTTSCKYQFSLCTDCAPLVNYNVKSVMHYRSTRDLSSCRVGGKAVLLNKSGGLINHEWVITGGDLNAIAELYGPAPSTGSGGSGGTGGGPTGGSTGTGAVAGSAGAGGFAGTAGTSGSAGGPGAAGNDGVDWNYGGWGGLAGAGTAGSAGNENGQTTTRTADGSEGNCGCRTPARRDSAPSLVALLGFAALTIRRRRARS